MSSVPMTLEFTQGSGSVSVDETTYFCCLLSESVYGLSFCFGQKSANPS